MSARSSKISDQAVFAATGRRWGEWFSILDSDGALQLNHAEIARLVWKRHGTSQWWAQTVTVEYERERGLRDVHQTARGYEVSVSKTIPASVGDLFAVWEDDRRRYSWMGVEMKVRKANPNKSVRLETGGAGSDLSVHFFPKGEARCQVVVQQIKLADREAVESQRAFWKAALARLADSA